MELAAINPEAAVELVRLFNQVGIMNWLKRYGENFLHYMMPPQLLFDMHERSRGRVALFEHSRGRVALLTMCRILQEIGEGGDLSHSAEEILSRWLTPEMLSITDDYEPEDLFSLLDLMRIAAKKGWLDQYGGPLLAKALRAVSVEWLLLGKPMLFMQALRMLQLIDLGRTKQEFLAKVRGFLDTSDGVKILLRQLPLEALPELQWLAQQTADPRLNTAILALLSGERTE